MKGRYACCEGVALTFFGEEGYGVALQVGEMYHRPCKVEPGDYGIFTGDAGGMGITAGIVLQLAEESPQIRSLALDSKKKAKHRWDMGL